MKTIAVTVLRPVEGPRDRLGNPTRSGHVAEEVAGVLVAPGASADMEASRPEGSTVALTLHFPKSYTARLKGCSVRLPEPWAETFRVVGDPQPYMAGNTPGRWNRAVEVEAADG